MIKKISKSVRKPRFWNALHWVRYMYRFDRL